MFPLWMQTNIAKAISQENRGTFSAFAITVSQEKKNFIPKRAENNDNNS